MSKMIRAFLLFVFLISLCTIYFLTEGNRREAAAWGVVSSFLVLVMLIVEIFLGASKRSRKDG